MTARFSVTKDGTIKMPEWTYNRKDDSFVRTIIQDSRGHQIPNPEAITLLRSTCKLRRFLERWAAEVVR